MAPGSRTSLVNIQPLPVIEEDENSTAGARNGHHPHLPFKSRRRSALADGTGAGVVYPPFARPPPRDFHTGLTPGEAGSADASKTSSKEGDDDEKANAEAALARNNHEWFARRGGWYRVCLIVSLFVVIVTALAVGLTVGLKKK